MTSKHCLQDNVSEDNLPKEYLYTLLFTDNTYILLLKYLVFKILKVIHRSL